MRRFEKGQKAGQDEINAQLKALRAELRKAQRELRRLRKVQ
jgi:hypothetical protein